MKIAFVGGGSYTWAMGFVVQCTEAQHAKNIRLCLMDIDPKAAELVKAAGDLFVKNRGAKVTIEATSDLDLALDGADFVLVAISTGGLAMMQYDVGIPEKYGIYHTVGDTVGPGGWLRTVRNVPVFRNLAQRMSKLCPNAWMLNVTNPLTPLTRVPYKLFGIKTIGMCHGIENVVASLCTLVGKGNGCRRDYTSTGVDHGSFILKLHADGLDVLEELKKRGYYRSDDQLPEFPDTDDPYIQGSSLRAIFAIWREIGYMPGISDRHMVENFPWFLAEPDGKLKYGIRQTNMNDRQRRHDQCRERLENFIKNQDVKFMESLGHGGSDPLIATMEALSGYRSMSLGCNYRNVGQIPEAPVNSVVETRCVISADSVHPSPSSMPDVIKSIVLPIIWRQEKIIDIALDGTFDELVALVTIDPLCSRMPFGQCRQMVREMIEATSKYITNPKLLQCN